MEEYIELIIAQIADKHPELFCGNEIFWLGYHTGMATKYDLYLKHLKVIGYNKKLISLVDKEVKHYEKSMQI